MGQTTPVPPQKKRRPIAPAADPSGTTALRLSEPAQRLRAAQAERDALLAKIGRRKAALEATEQAARDATAKITNRVAPKMQEVRTFDQEIHELLEAMTHDRARPQRERSAIRRVHLDLQRRGVLSPRAQASQDEPPPLEDLDDVDAFDDQQDAPSAARPRDSQHGVLRALFRRLVELFHPDKVQDDAEKAARTEIMKEITEAYRHGDLARLLEVERRWQHDHPHRGAGQAEASADALDEPELERRYLAVERSNEELRQQLRDIEREVRAVRKSPHGALARALKRARRDGFDESDLEIVQEVEAAAAELRTLRDFVAAFRDRKISFTAFMRGPAAPEPAADDYEEFLDAITQLAQQMLHREREHLAHTSRPSPRRSRRR